VENTVDVVRRRGSGTHRVLHASKTIKDRIHINKHEKNYQITWYEQTTSVIATMIISSYFTYEYKMH